MKQILRIGMTAVAVVGALVVGLTAASASSAPTGTPPAAPAVGRMTPAVASDPQTQPETLFRPVTPCRIVDTRLAHGALASGAVRDFYVGGTFGFAPQGGLAGGCGIPSGAVAVAAVVTAVSPQGPGYLRAWAAGSTEPNASILTYPAHTSAGSGVTLPLRSTGGTGLRLHNFGGPVQVVIDVQGFYLPQIQALIGGSGVIDAGTSRIVSTSHPSTGFYYVTLDRPARQCSPQATTFNLYRYASVGLSSSSTPNTISVFVWQLDPTTHKEVPTDYTFFLTVTC